jgi:N-acetylmuramoyl-L-alanine amidase
MTRDNDTFIPLPGRAARGNRQNDAIFCSVHYNCAGGSTPNGIETYYYHDSSRLLAAYVQAYLIKTIPTNNRGVKSASFHVIRETRRNPAILVEAGFVSNPRECARMCTGAYRQAVAESIARGLIAYTRTHR